MNALVRRALGEAIPHDTVEGFVAVQADGSFYEGQHPHSIAFSEHRAILERSLPVGAATLVPATLVVHREYAEPHV